MPRLRTHYDTLKVSRDAPIEVIQAAYRSLARKHHPDRTGSSPEAEATMKAINAAYEILSDPARRAQHDEWIAAHTANAYSTSGDGTPEPGSSPRSSGSPVDSERLSPTTILLIVCYVAAAVFLLRIPGPARVIGLMMLMAGWGIFQYSRRKRPDR